MKVLCVLLGAAVVVSACITGPQVVSLSAESGGETSPTLELEGDYRVRLDLLHPEREECRTWRVTLGRLGSPGDVFRLEVDEYATIARLDGGLPARFVTDYDDGGYTAKVWSLDGEYVIDAAVPASCGPWTVSFTHSES